MFDPLSSLPGYALRRASSAMLADLNARLSPLGVRHIEAAILSLIGTNPNLTQSHLCRTLGIERANMVPLIARLEARGLIARARVDGRSHGLSLTPDGEALTTEVDAAMRAHEQALIDRIAPGDRAAFMRALAALWSGEGLPS